MKTSEERLTSSLERIEASNANLKVWVMATAIALGGLLFAARRLSRWQSRRPADVAQRGVHIGSGVVETTCRSLVCIMRHSQEWPDQRFGAAPQGGAGC